MSEIDYEDDFLQSTHELTGSVAGYDDDFEQGDNYDVNKATGEYKLVKSVSSNEDGWADRASDHTENHLSKQNAAIEDDQYADDFDDCDTRNGASSVNLKEERDLASTSSVDKSHYSYEGDPFEESDNESFGVGRFLVDVATKKSASLAQFTMPMQPTSKASADECNSKIVALNTTRTDTRRMSEGEDAPGSYRSALGSLLPSDADDSKPELADLSQNKASSDTTTGPSVNLKKERDFGGDLASTSSVDKSHYSYEGDPFEESDNESFGVGRFLVDVATKKSASLAQFTMPISNPNNPSGEIVTSKETASVPSISMQETLTVRTSLVGKGESYVTMDDYIKTETNESSTGEGASAAVIHDSLKDVIIHDDVFSPPAVAESSFLAPDLTASSNSSTTNELALASAYVYHNSDRELSSDMPRRYYAYESTAMIKEELSETKNSEAMSEAIFELAKDVTKEKSLAETTKELRRTKTSPSRETLSSVIDVNALPADMPENSVSKPENRSSGVSSRARSTTSASNSQSSEIVTSKVEAFDATMPMQPTSKASADECNSEIVALNTARTDTRRMSEGEDAPGSYRSALGSLLPSDADDSKPELADLSQNKASFAKAAPTSTDACVVTSCQASSSTQLRQKVLNEREKIDRNLSEGKAGFLHVAPQTVSVKKYHNGDPPQAAIKEIKKPYLPDCGGFVRPSTAPRHRSRSPPGAHIEKGHILRQAALKEMKKPPLPKLNKLVRPSTAPARAARSTHDSVRVVNILETDEQRLLLPQADYRRQRKPSLPDFTKLVQHYSLTAGRKKYARKNLKQWPFSPTSAYASDLLEVSAAPHIIKAKNTNFEKSSSAILNFTNLLRQLVTIATVVTNTAHNDAMKRLLSLHRSALKALKRRHDKEIEVCFNRFSDAIGHLRDDSYSQLRFKEIVNKLRVRQAREFEEINAYIDDPLIKLDERKKRQLHEIDFILKRANDDVEHYLRLTQFTAATNGHNEAANLRASQGKSHAFRLLHDSIVAVKDKIVLIPRFYHRLVATNDETYNAMSSQIQGYGGIEKLQYKSKTLSANRNSKDELTTKKILDDIEAGIIRDEALVSKSVFKKKQGDEGRRAEVFTNDDSDDESEYTDDFEETIREAKAESGGNKAVGQTGKTVHTTTVTTATAVDGSSYTEDFEDDDEEMTKTYTAVQRNPQPTESTLPTVSDLVAGPSFHPLSKQRTTPACLHCGNSFQGVGKYLPSISGANALIVDYLKQQSGDAATLALASKASTSLAQINPSIVPTASVAPATAAAGARNIHTPSSKDPPPGYSYRAPKWKQKTNTSTYPPRPEPPTPSVYCSWECVKRWSDINSPNTVKYERALMIDVSAGYVVT